MQERPPSTQGQRAAEAEGRPSAEARLRKGLDIPYEAFVSMDAGGFVADWNPAAEEMFGLSRAEAVGQVLADLIIPPEYREAHWAGLRHYLETGDGPVLGRRLELSALRRDGEEFPVELRIFVLEDEGRRTFHAFLRERSQRR